MQKKSNSEPKGYSSEQISHMPSSKPLENIVKDIESRIDSEDPLKNLKLDLLHQLTKFELGKFLLINKGLNGYWTNYILTYPTNNIEVSSNLERVFLEELPSILATQQRYKIFLKYNQQSEIVSDKFIFLKAIQI